MNVMIAEKMPCNGYVSILHLACSFGCTDTVSLLIKNGTKFNYKDFEKALTEGYE